MGRNKHKSIEHSLDDFQDAPTEHGLSLDQLSESFARLLGTGEVPYAETASNPTHGLALEPVSTNEVELDGEHEVAVSPENILEAILFVGNPTGEPISSRQIASLMRGVRAAEVEQRIEQLNASYEQNRCPYYIESMSKGFRLALRSEFNFVRERFYGRVRQVSLAQSAITALALVAYNQPISRTGIAGIAEEPVVRQLGPLVRRGLLSVERKKNQNRTESFYCTTDRFLDLFGLTSLDELPRSQELDE